MSKSTHTRTASVDSSPPRLAERHRALLGALQDIGLVRRGSIAHRLARCGNPTCRCKANPPMRHGPSYLWTRQVAGKTVTAMLSPELVTHGQEWSRNMRERDRIVRKPQGIGLRAATVVRRG